jgi:hypothetical protein
MRRLIATALVLGMIGCEKPRQTQVAMTVEGPPSPCDTNVWLVNTVADAQVKNGVIARHTLYAHEFIPDSATLNDLGQRDLAILADHYRQFPGPLNIGRGDEPRELYERRVATVMQGLQQAGVDTNRIRAADALPGGDGSSSERVLLVLRRSQQSPRGAGAANDTAAGLEPMGVMLKGSQP